MLLIKKGHQPGSYVQNHLSHDAGVVSPYIRGLVASELDIFFEALGEMNF